MQAATEPGRPVVLITGIAGYSGSHLADWLLKQHQRVVGIDIEGASTTNLHHILDRIELQWADIRDLAQVRKILANTRPDRIYHLAALTKSGSNREHRALYDVNVYGTMNLLEAVREEGMDCRVLIAGSSAQYGLVAPGAKPIGETQPPRPVTHYAVSKVTQDMLGFAYWATDAVEVVRTRAFNIVGPRQGAEFVASAVARQIARIEQGREEPVLKVGNLDAQRDFVDVRDAVRAYQLALEQGQPGEAYNVCSGRGRPIRALLEELLALSTVRDIAIHQDPARMQAADVPIQVGSFEKLHRQTGWQPEIPFGQTLRDLLDYWRRRTQEEA